LVEGGWSERRGFTYTGKEVLLIRVSPVVDTALKFRGQCDFGLVVGCGQRHTGKAASGGWWMVDGVVEKEWGIRIGQLIHSKSNPQKIVSNNSTRVLYLYLISRK